MVRLLLPLVLMLAAGMSAAGDRSSLWPDVPKATGAPHAEGNAYWRKHHMEMMRHDRDLTMRDGDRMIAASLKGCFDCHTVTDETGATVTYASEKHFCRSCHDFAAVKVDCFMCHRSTPDGVDETVDHAALTDRRAGDILAYLRAIGEGGE
ncbi:hypothetical protein LCL97_00250 [Seohaeicola saemankumensis]|nr:hypothetical protein [Seohaeicola saemankumensis]MCA0869243.1 hypothetical protein [Seohaeicola saemankumensis]